MIIIKYIMIFFVFLFSFVIGNLISKKYILRVKELKEFKSALNIIENKIKFTYETLPEVFIQISKVTSNNISKIFRQASENMKKIDAQKAWDNALENVVSNLKNEDIDNIKELGKMLGKMDKDGQISSIELTKTFIDMQIDKAKQEENKNAKMYKTLGAIVGLAFVIILI